MESYQPELRVTEQVFNLLMILAKQEDTPISTSEIDYMLGNNNNHVTGLQLRSLAKQGLVVALGGNPVIGTLWAITEKGKDAKKI